MNFNNQEALERLGAELQLHLAFNDEGVCDVIIDDALVALEGFPDDTSLRLNAVVGRLENPDDPASLRLLLHANFNGQGVGAASLGLNHESGEVILGRAVDVFSLGEAGLAPVLEDFANYLIYWKKNLGRLVERAKSNGGSENEVLESNSFLRV